MDRYCFFNEFFYDCAHISFRDVEYVFSGPIVANKQITFDALGFVYYHNREFDK